VYIHRIAIDTNRLNARGSLPEMTELERLHSAGAIELVCTSTMITDAKGPWATKAKQYDQIYSDCMGYFTNLKLPDTQPGPVLRESRFFEIYKNVFGKQPELHVSGSQAKYSMTSIRDALHIDQCWQNMVDYFLTNESCLQGCGIVDFKICDAAECLADLKGFFQGSVGTADVDKLSAKISALPPVILGSNTVGAFEVAIPDDEGALLRVEIQGGVAVVYATVRDKGGAILVQITSDGDYVFSPKGGSVNLIAGPSPMRLGPKHCKSFAVNAGGRALLAGRVVNPGRVVIFEALLRDRDGSDVLAIHRHLLEIGGCDFRIFPIEAPPDLPL